MRVNKRGWTLLELIVVMAIIVVLTGLAFTVAPSVIKTQSRNAALQLAKRIDLAKGDFLESGATADADWNAAVDDQARYELLKQYLGTVMPDQLGTGTESGAFTPHGFRLELGDLRELTQVIDVGDGSIVIPPDAGSTSFVLNVDSADPSRGQVSGAGTYLAGSVATIRASPYAGSVFVDWTEGGVSISTASTTTVTVNNTRNIRANFAAAPVGSYTLTVNVLNGTGGTVSGGGSYSAGGTATAIATPSAGYTFAGWTGDVGGANPSSASITLTMDRHRLIQAAFVRTSATLTVISADPALGVVSGGGRVPLGSTVTIKATSYPGALFTKWVRDGVDFGVSQEFSYTVDADRTFTAVFVADTSGVGPGGTYGGATKTLTVEVDTRGRVLGIVENDLGTMASQDADDISISGGSASLDGLSLPSLAGVAPRFMVVNPGGALSATAVDLSGYVLRTGDTMTGTLNLSPSSGLALQLNGSLRGNQSGSVRVDSGSGYLDIGAQNGSFAHFMTDRPSYYFNTGVQVNGSMGSYSGNFNLQTAGTTRFTLNATDGSASSTGRFLAGGGYVVQNGQDGGPGRGLYMWTGTDTNWGIYMGQAGSGRSLGGGTAVAGHDFSAHAIRFRVANNASQGFIWENASDSRLMSLNGNTGVLNVAAGIQVGGNTVWHSGNDGAGSGLDADLLDGYNSGTTGANVVLRTESSGYLGLDNWARVSGIYNSNGNHVGFGGNYVWTRSGNGLQIQDNAGATKGYLYQDGAGFGLLNGGGSWAVRTTNDGGELYGTWYATDVRSNIFYDRQDTGYYVDPNGNSRLHAVRPTYLESPHSGSDSGVAPGHYRWGYQQAGSWSNPYPDLILGYHTGVKIGGHTTYGGTRFYSDHPDYSSTELMSVGNGDSHVRVANNLYVGGAIVAGGTNIDSLYLRRTVNAWLTDSEGQPRMYWGSGLGRAYYRSNGYTWRNYSGSDIMTMDNSGNVSAASFYASSTRRLKANILPMESMLDKVTRLQGVRYQWSEGPRKGQADLGFIAEEVNDLFPEVVGKDSEGVVTGVDYGRLSSVLVEAVKELRAENAALEARVAAAEERTRSSEARLLALEAKVGSPNSPVAVYLSVAAIAACVAGGICVRRRNKPIN